MIPLDLYSDLCRTIGPAAPVRSSGPRPRRGALPAPGARFRPVPSMRRLPPPVLSGTIALCVTLLVAGCSRDESGAGETRTVAVVPPPQVSWALPEREVTSPVNVADGEEIAFARTLLRRIVEERGLDEDNPWAVAHAILALGLDVDLPNGKPAVDFLFSEYARVTEIGGEKLIGFPLETKRRVRDPKTGRTITRDIPVEPHPELILKSLVERGALPDRSVLVEGQPFRLGDLYRHGLVKAWVDGGRLGHGHWNNAPWGIQAAATWAPKDLAWTAEGGRAMTLDRYVHAAVAELRARTRAIRQALADGRATVAEAGLDPGLEDFTCGGAHFLQGVGYALARGFGTEEDRADFRDQIEVLFWSFDDRKTKLQAAIEQQPASRFLFLTQLFKFSGHFVETSHKFAALGLFEPTKEQELVMVRATGELIANAIILDRLNAFRDLEEIRAADEQFYLDLVGDSAHGLRGLDLALGQGTVAY